MRIIPCLVYTMLFGGPAIAPGCATSDHGAEGTLSINLVGQAASGAIYRLRDATLTVAGPDATQVFHTEDDPDRSELSADVDIGDYTAQLADGWHLERVDGGSASIVDATLVSPNPAHFTVFAAQRTIVPLHFQVDLGDVDMSQGYDIVLTIDEVSHSAALAPVAPSAAHPMLQGGQQLFKAAGNTTCTGRVAASMAFGSFCYLGSDDEVRCAGQVAETRYGMTFQPTGQHGASQIMLMFAIDNGMCVTRTDHTLQCMGTNTNAFGSSGVSPAFQPWADRSDIASMTTGTWDQLCALTLGGQVLCGGIDYGYPFVTVGTPGQTSVWVDGSGTAHLGDPTVLRPGTSRTECQVKAHGLDCGIQSFGPTDGSIVMGTLLISGFDPFGTACWLTADATVNCTFGPRFAPGRVLYLAADFYTDSLCAIYNDGSVWCIGSNTNGKLGTGDDTALEVETRVAPPGSARVGCDR